MGYGFGGILLVVGLVLALAVDDSKVQGVHLTTVGWILTLVGAVILVLTAVTLNGGRRTRSRQTTLHPDGSQTVRDNRADM